MTNYLRNWFQNRRQNARPAKTAFDFYSIGYPKTGNTWTRILLGSYVRSLHNLPELPLFDPVEMAELKSRGYDGPTGIFTHQPLEWSDQDSGELTFQNVIAPFLEQKVILLVRHPLDTLVSSFMHWKHRSTPQYSGTLRDFVSDPVFGLDKLLRFYQLWADHHTAVGSFLCARYEDTHRDTTGQLSRLVAFLEERVDENAIRDAVSFSSFENLKGLEASGTRLVYKSSGFHAFGDGDRSNPDAFHIRNGKVAGYRTELPPEIIADLEERVQAEMPQIYGYT
ncbi:sulfotransferase domain-containing protein [Youhaiella tibetensis]|uniref:sulfotransferase domain-containing protein n=1 Tax=Paradevosia tibetensis TaxID=1447062 RepID=UPI0014792AEC|nr:sulfotransferase domain-containing protein [Youhaiella tibetensis]